MSADSVRSGGVSIAAVPSLLILMGALFLADYHWGLPVIRSWPAILIAAGLLRLAGWGR